MTPNFADLTESVSMLEILKVVVKFVPVHVYTGRNT
jgi:hypothetical protein